MAPRRSWAKANNPFWSNNVAAWYRSALEADQHCRKHDLSATSLMRWACRASAEFAAENTERSTQTEQSKRRRRYSRYRYGVRTDTGPVAFRRSGACMWKRRTSAAWGMPSTLQRSVSRRIRCASGAIAWNNPATKWTGAACFIRVSGRN